METCSAGTKYKSSASWAIIVATVCSLFLLSTSRSAAQPHQLAQDKFVDAWRMKQTTKIYGVEDVLVSQAGIKATNPKTKISFFMSSPFEQVTVYNAGTGKFFQTELKQFRCPVLKTFTLFNSYELGSQPMVKVGEGKLNGLNILKYQTTKEFSAKQLMLRKTDKVPSSNPAIIDSQSTEDFHIPAAAGTGLCRYYGIPKVPGIPIEVVCKDLDMTASFFLQTTGLTKVKVSPSEFLLPNAFKRVKSIEETSRSEMDDDAMQLFGK